MNTKQRIEIRRTIEADALAYSTLSYEPATDRPVNGLTARITESANILKSTLCQSDIDLLNEQVLGKSIEQRRQILNAWYNWADEIAAIVAQNSNGHFAGNVWKDARRAEASQKRDQAIKEVNQPTIYETVVATVDQLTYNPTKIIIWESETNSNKIYLTPDGLGNLFLVYLKNGKQVVVRVAYVPGYALAHNVWHLDFSKTRYKDFVARCRDKKSAPKRELQGGFLARESQHNYGKRRYR